MEVVIGFAIGFWVGTRQGREGLQRAMESAQAIWAHPETKRLLSQGLAAAEPMLEKKRSLSVLRSVLGERHADA